MKFHSAILDNGLRVIGEENEYSFSSSLGFFVRAGSRDEDLSISGVSHFLEHMMFKGTEKRTALDITYELGEIGAQANAFTSEEHTVYYMSVLPEYLSKALNILSDMLKSTLSEEEFKVEKNVILEEISLYQDKPSHLIYERGISEYFNGHSAGNSVLGTKKSVGDLTREKMLDYFNSRYSPSNMVLAVSGNFNWDSFLEEANSLCGKWIDKKVIRDVKPHTNLKEKKVIITKEGLNCAHLCFFTPGPDLKDLKRYSCRNLCSLLGSISGSKTYWELVNKGISEVCYIDFEDMEGVGVIYGYLKSAPSRLEEARDILYKIMSNPMDFEKEALKRVKTKAKTSLVFLAERPIRRLISIGLDYLYKEEYVSLEEELERINRVSLLDIENLVEEFNFKPVTEIRLLPE